MKYIICIQDSPVKKEPQSKRKMERVSMSSLKDKAYEIIKKRIMDATYPAQTFIDEKALAQELNTSRTPVREALIAPFPKASYRSFQSAGSWCCPLPIRMPWIFFRSVCSLSRG